MEESKNVAKTLLKILAGTSEALIIALVSSGLPRSHFYFPHDATTSLKTTAWKAIFMFSYPFRPCTPLK